MKIQIFDTETTGLIAPIEPIEVAYLDIEFPSLKINDRFCQQYKPSKPIEYGALATSHILLEDLENFQESSNYIFEENEPLVDQELNQVGYLIGHNIDYDWKVIGKPYVKRICTKAMASSLWPDLDSYSQSALLYFLLGSKAKPLLKEAHNALCDVENNLILLEYILEEISSHSAVCIETIEDLWKFSEQCRIPTKMTFGKFKGQPYSALDRGYVNWWLNTSDTKPDEYQIKALHIAGFKV